MKILVTFGHRIDRKERKKRDVAIHARLRDGQACEALPSLKQELMWFPNDPGLAYLLALAHSGMKDGVNELRWLKHAAVMAPNNATRLTSLGQALRSKGEIEAAYDLFHRALEQNPNYAQARYNRALLELASEHYERGWRDYESRFAIRSVPGVWRPFSSPIWDGKSELEGKLLIWAEQSTSIQILFATVLRELSVKHGLIFECEPYLKSIFQRSFPDWEIIPQENPANPRLSDPDIAANIPLGRLCGIRRQSFYEFPKTMSYLFADPERSIDLMLEVGQPSRRTLGLSWRGAVGHSDFKLEQLETILKTESVTWVSLEGPDADPEIEAFEKTSGIHIVHGLNLDLDHNVNDLCDLIAACELVVTPDNQRAHLSGALGTAVWTLLPNTNGARWYWFSRHNANPRPFSCWYPSMRIVWQQNGEALSEFKNRTAAHLRKALAAD